MENENKNISVPTVTSETGGKDNLKTMSNDDLNNLLGEVLEHEDYIKAIAIRDELKARGLNH